MKFRYVIFLLFTAFTYTLQAQIFISAKLVDSISKKPIPFATIAFNHASGVISNDNGKFQMHVKTNSEKDTLFISCLGYETKYLPLVRLRDSIIILKPKSIALNEVLVSNKNYTVDQIIAKTYERIAENYNFDYNKSKLFYRESYFTDIIKNSVKVKKTTIPEFNQKFIDSILIFMPKKADDYTEILGELYTKTNSEDSQKLDIIKASHLYDKSKKLNFEGLEEKFNTILKKHVKRDSYFKIKSGIFGTKEDIDASFFDGADSKKTETDTFLEAKKKQEQERKKNFLKHRKETISHLKRASFIFKDSHLNFLEKSRKYEFELLDYLFLNDNFVYKISFTPKRGADYKGMLYINTADFAIVRVDYENVKTLKSFNLLGLSYNENLHKGTLIYSKNITNTYVLKYAESKTGNKFGIKRPLKIIEKNKHTKGRRKQNEVSTDIHFVVSYFTKKELVVFETETVSANTFNTFKEKANIKPTYLPKYDPNFWEGYNIIEPNQAIKDFKSIENLK